MKIKKLFRNGKVVFLLIVLILMIWSIHPNPFTSGVAIHNVVPNSTASIAGMQTPKPGTQPMNQELITSINNKPIKSLDDYYSEISLLEINRSVHIKTNRGTYVLRTRELVLETATNKTQERELTEPIFNATLNQTINWTHIVKSPIVVYNHTGFVDALGINVEEAPKTNIRKGLELQGGTRILLQPEDELDKPDVDTLIGNMRERLNVYGLSDVKIVEAGDLSGNQFILVEIAGATEEEVKELLAKQGKFEAKIGDKTVFLGGQDITYVCRSPDCSGMDPSRPCGMNGDQWVCFFRFSITLSTQAAQRQADLTRNLAVVSDSGTPYLNESLLLYLDDNLVDTLQIGADLKGQATTQISISGSGAGATQLMAAQSASESMKRLQTVLITGSLPVKLNIVKLDAISPVLGKEFLRNALFMGVVALAAIASSIYIRYKKPQIVIPIILTLTSEVVILLGFAALVHWNLDLAGIAGIIIAIGTGVDHLIVITDGTLRKESSESTDWKTRIKNAFSIIFVAFFTMTVAMIPLWFAGAGLLRGFVFTTLAGAVIGVLIARPAYAATIEILLSE
ncbi:MAG TPA: hypothetical protein VJH97_03180 [Candidatus Nanoarchaeia archaeon]|nr:hypothetical protein [Candidatus Nanoarchaeia archaeon]